MDDRIKRLRLQRDKSECQLSKLFGITELSKKPCTEDLELHHITYARYGCERIEDVITVCVRCHDVLTNAIRKERYAGNAEINGNRVQELCIENGPDNVNIKERRLQNAQEVTLSVGGDYTVNHAQPSTRRSSERLYEGDQTGIGQTEKG